MDALVVLLLVAGLVLLVVGAEVLVRGASALAIAAGISPLVVGLTVVAYGTSAPELAVGVQAGLSGEPEIALGNVVGSNIFNILFVLGACALVTPLVVQQELVRRDVPVMIGVSVLLLVLVLDGRLSPLEGVGLLAGVVIYSAWVIRAGRQATAAERADDTAPARRVPVPRNIGLVVAGLAMLVLGGRWLVDGAVQIAEELGLSELVIGLTVVAIGTSLPEVATSLAAVRRGERDIAVGNAVGSNIFNVLLIVGATAVVSSGGIDVPASLPRFDLPVMTVVAVACLPIFFTGCSITRREGALFLAYYVAYTLYLLFDATGHDAQPVLGTVMLLFVVPLTVLTLVILVLRERAERSR